MSNLPGLTRLRTRPCLEALEDRCCPTTASLANGVLTITGDGSANHVYISQNDSANTFYVEYDYTVFGQSFMLSKTFSSTDVNIVKVYLKGGDDVFTHYLNSDLLYSKMFLGNLGLGNDVAYLSFGDGQIGHHIKANLAVGLTMGPESGDGNDTVGVGLGEVDGKQVQVNAYLGSGDDSFTAHLTGHLLQKANASFGVFGQDGVDELRLIGGYTLIPYPSGEPVKFPSNIGAGAKLDVHFDGGSGDDLLGIYYYGQIKGELRHHLEGGDGVDIVLPMITKLDGSTGQVVAY